MRGRAFAPHAAAALVVAFLSGPAQAQSLSGVFADRIEEDWVLVLDSTAASGGPQINTVMSPGGDSAQSAVILDINYRHYPTYATGGIQVLVYNQGGLASSKTVVLDPLQTADETVQWTQRMKLEDGQVKYLIPSLSSTTWGAFTSDVVLASFSTSLGTFATYNSDTSASASGGAWKTSGLKSLTLVAVRYYSGKTLLATDNTTRTVDCTKPFTRP